MTGNVLGEPGPGEMTRCRRCSANGFLLWQDDTGRTHRGCAHCGHEDVAYFVYHYGELPPLS